MPAPVRSAPRGRARRCKRQPQPLAHLEAGDLELGDPPSSASFLAPAHATHPEPQRAKRLVTELDAIRARPHVDRPLAAAVHRHPNGLGGPASVGVGTETA